MNKDHEPNRRLSNVLLKVFNHSFDGQAHESGKTDKELFELMIKHIQEQRIPVREADVREALRKARDQHERMIPLGKMDPRGRDRANEVVDRLDQMFDDYFHN